MASITTPWRDQWEQNIGERSGLGSAGTGENDVPTTASITQSWANPTRITSQLSLGNSTLTTPGGAAPYILPYLRASNFGVSIPSGATIVGVQAQIVYAAFDATFTEDEVRLAWGASAANLSPNNASGNKALGAQQTANSEVLYGGPTDTWGSTLTPADFDSDFGLVLKVGRASGAGGSDVVGVDAIRLIVWFDSFTGAGNARMTQNYAEVLTTTKTPARLTQTYAEVLTSISTPLTYPTGRRQAVIVT